MGDSGHHKKRKRIPMDDTKKLLLGHRVEVRSIEDGFQGSWHAGVITDCRSGVRTVKYDHLLCDDESGFLIEDVQVSGMVDGIFCSSETRDEYRGRIRPPPPIRKLEREKITYGVCVDAYYNEAWWEGVVFDMEEDCSDYRNVFFPDLGDEMNVEIKDLRITLDWDENTGEWKPRGKWLFLVIIEELEKNTFIPVSVKQIWYDVRERKEFGQIGEWACPVKPLWQELVVEVINNQLDLSMDEFLSSCDFSEAVLENGEPISAHNSSTMILTPQSNLADSKAIVGPTDISVSDGGLMTLNESSSPMVSDPNNGGDELAMVTPDTTSSRSSNPTACSSNHQAAPVETKSLSIITSDQKMLTGYGFYDDRRHVGEPELKEAVESADKNHFDGRCKLDWQPGYAKLKLKPEFSPNCIKEYSLSSNKAEKARLTRTVRNHLLYLGWKVDYCIYRNNCRVRYTSPEGKRFYLIGSVCDNFASSSTETSTPMIEDVPDRSPDSLNFSPLDNKEGEIRTKRKYRKRKKPCMDPKYSSVSVEPAYCPDAVFEYLKCLKKKYHLKDNQDELIVKARKHLAAIGWSLWFKPRKGKKDEWRYDSPNTKKTYTSLKSACKAIAKAEERISNATSGSTSMEELMCSEEPKDLSSELASSKKEDQDNSPSQKWSRNYSMLRKYRAGGIKKLHKKRNGIVRSLSSLFGSNEQLEGHNTPNKLKDEGMQSSVMRLSTNFLSKKRSTLGKVKRSLDGKKLNRVQRSSKRIRQAEPSSSSQAPRTVLSWLIDNNPQLLRAKVYYCKQNGAEPTAEGRLTGEGIRCLCCREVFTLSGFEDHAKSNCHQPAANIYLEDGRSLVECQMEVIHQKFRRYPRKPLLGKAKRNQHQTWNDNICSVCRYGGELILCDRCPSSFHASCLKLQNIPEGDWFCPSCCCGICGESQFDVDSTHFTDKSVLCCHQCERLYHACCIRDRETVKLDVRPKENWFCSKACEKVHWGLEQLIGKPILVGHNNLTWTLVRPANYEGSHQNGCDIVITAETYSKLGVALEVMHECFDPVKEPKTQRDIVEDVIFCRSSNLNRLNFSGFYTVLLERNDELITVATLRVYGDKVAEIPLIGTRFQHRRLGMCRILMNEIEKNLVNLGVKRLVLPAATSVVDTWTSSFGFLPVTESDRSELLGYTFLDFQDTVMCQKELRKKDPSTLSHLLRYMPVVDPEPWHHIGGSNCVIDFEANSGISEVSQDDQHEGSETVDQL